MVSFQELPYQLILLLTGWSVSFSEAHERIAGYQPRTVITDHAAIDLDQLEIEKWLAEGIFSVAEGIYQKGGHSQSIAKLKLLDAEAPPTPFPVGSFVFGWAEDGDDVQGTLLEEAKWQDDTGEVELTVAYDVAETQENYLDCQVGGLVLSESANDAGCFESKGIIQLLHFARSSPARIYNYKYEMTTDNVNGRTIQKFSTKAFSEMWNCTHCPYDTFEKFVKYYGTTDYGDQWVVAALEGAETSFDNGNADFRTEAKAVRAEAVRIATKYMIIWMYVIRTMEFALEECEATCTKSDVLYEPVEHAHCDDSPIKAWDQAVAFYAGSLQGEDGTGDGVLLFALADEMCPLFQTCGSESDSLVGTSYVNSMIIDEFTSGQIGVLTRRCDGPRESKETIETIMAVPLVQATLYNAYERSYHPATTAEEISFDAVQGAAYASTVLPLVHHCSHEDAKIIYENLRLKGEDVEDVVDFVAVKSAFERNYKCMAITCQMVGGVVENGSYAPFAAPCKDDSDDENDGMAMVVFLGVLGGALVVSALFNMAHQRYREGVDHAFGGRAATTVPDILQVAREFD